MLNEHTLDQLRALRLEGYEPHETQRQSMSKIDENLCESTGYALASMRYSPQFSLFSPLYAGQPADGVAR